MLPQLPAPSLQPNTCCASCLEQNSLQLLLARGAQFKNSSHHSKLTAICTTACNFRLYANLLYNLLKGLQPFMQLPTCSRQPAAIHAAGLMWITLLSIADAGQTIEPSLAGSCT